MRASTLALPVLLLAGCSASGVLADALSGSGGSYATDDDPELVAAAVPFGLKTMEGVLVEQPEHRGLLLALASGFTQYAYAFVLQEADRVAEESIERSDRIEARGRKLLLRARGYGMRGLEVEHEGFGAQLREAPEAALARLGPDDVPHLYWTTASWALSIAAGKFDPAALAEFPTVQAMGQRLLALDDTYNGGAAHSMMMSLEAARPGGDLAVAEQHYQRALALSDGTSVGLYVAYAESVCVKKQDSRAFHRALNTAMKVDVDAHPEKRLENTIFLRRAKRLKASSEDLFLEDVGDQETETSSASVESSQSS